MWFITRQQLIQECCPLLGWSKAHWSMFVYFKHKQYHPFPNWSLNRMQAQKQWPPVSVSVQKLYILDTLTKVQPCSRLDSTSYHPSHNWYEEVGLWQHCTPNGYANTIYTCTVANFPLIESVCLLNSITSFNKKGYSCWHGWAKTRRVSSMSNSNLYCKAESWSMQSE